MRIKVTGGYLDVEFEDNPILKATEKLKAIAEKEKDNLINPKIDIKKDIEEVKKEGKPEHII